MKIHYTSGNFYIEKDGKKIKIANPELLPTLLVYTGYKDEIVWGYHDRYYLIRENDTFDLPKDLIIGGICHGCNRVGMRNCAHADTCGMNEIFLSKSSSPEIPDSSTSIDQLRLALNEDRVKELEAFIKGIAQSLYIGEDLKDKEVLEHYVQVVSIIKEQIKELLPSPPTVAGTSTELLNKLKEKEKQIDADMRSRIPTPEQMQVRVGMSCSKIPNNSEKPDLKQLCFSIVNSWTNVGEHSTFDAMIEGMDKIYNDYVIPRDKTISELQGKVDFYRSETAKIREYVSKPSIGRPTQGIFDAIMDEFKMKDKTISDLRERLKELESLLTKCDTTFGLVNQVIDNLKEQREVDPELLHVFVDTIDIDFELIQAKIKDELRTKP